MSTPISKINMSYYLVVFIRRINSLCFTTNVFLSNSYRTQGAASSAFALSDAAIRGILWKEGFIKVLKISKNTFFTQYLSSDNLLTGQQMIDLCWIKSSFQIYQLSFLNKKLIEAFAYILNSLKTKEKVGSSHQGFYPNTPFFQVGGYKARRIIKYFSKETKKWIYLCNTCHYVNFLSWKSTFHRFFVKDLNKPLPYY